MHTEKGVLLSEPPLKAQGHLCDTGGWVEPGLWRKNLEPQIRETWGRRGGRAAVPAGAQRARLPAGVLPPSWGAFPHSCLPNF